jgi:hypothetical protein
MRTGAAAGFDGWAKAAAARKSKAEIDRVEIAMSNYTSRWFTGSNATRRAKVLSDRGKSTESRNPMETKDA